ncbi:MAG: FHA domain-containing protein [Methanomicrobiales archaeon]|nr:FHA domain-containing protein [Methanomicrobiales archaeon]
MGDGSAVPASTTLAVTYDADFFHDLSELFEVLANSQRLQILKTIERESKDLRVIAKETGSTYENTKKHMYRLLSVGLVQREAGFGQPTPRGVFPVWKFSLVPRAMDRVLGALTVFHAIRPWIEDPAIRRRLDDLEKEIGIGIGKGKAALMVLTGPEEGRIIPLSGGITWIGRGGASAHGGVSGIVLSPWYASVTRISRPHAEIILEKGQWFIQDCDSTSGTSVNGVPITGNSPYPLVGSEMLELGKGPTSARLVFVRVDHEG